MEPEQAHRRAISAAQPVLFDGCFGWFHPQDVHGGTAVVLCNGLLANGAAAHRPFRQMADAFARAGFPALRFDYPGTGDAPDLPVDGQRDGQWEIWRHSVHAAADWLRRAAGAERIVLCGVGFGAMLAAAVAAERTDITGLILLAPYLRGRAFVRQLSLEAGLPRPGDAARLGIGMGEVNFSPADVAAISRLDLQALALSAGCRVAVFAQTPSPVLTACLEAWMERGALAECFDFAGLETLTQPTFMCHESVADVDRVAKWLRGWAAEDRAVPHTPAAGPQVQLLRAGGVETPLRFGSDECLFGILSRPAQGPASRLAVLLINSSGNPHYGFARLAVGLSRHFAAAGIAALRFDFAGLGDSLAPGDAPTHCFATPRAGDVSAAIDALSGLGYTSFAIVGLCSGAYHAFHAALADRRLGGLLLINLPLFQWRDGDPVEFLDFIQQGPSEFLPKLINKDVWGRLLRGELDIGGRVQMQAQWAIEKAGAIARRVARRIGYHPPPTFAQASMRDLATRARTLFLFSEGDPGIAMLEEEFGPATAPDGAEFEILTGFDHAITRPEMQQAVAQRMLGFVDRAGLVRAGTTHDQMAVQAA